MLRRLIWVFAGVLVLGGAGAFWLGARPLSYSARQQGVPTLVPLPRPALPEAAAAPAPPAHPDADAGAVGDGDDDSPLALDGLPDPPPTRRGPPARFGRTANYLLVGVDHAYGRQFGRADSLLLAVFDDGSGHVGLVSIPRDLFVEVPGYGPSRINATLRIGTKLHQDPLELLRGVASTALAVPIHHVVVANLDAFETAVDRLGGLTVDVPCAIEDNFIDRRTPTGRRLLHVPAGRQHLDGVTTAMYARSRHGRSDWDRARRQQAIVLALRDRANQLGIDAWLPVALDALERGVTTTMSRLQMLQLARRAAAVDRARLHGVVIGSRQTQIRWTDEHRAVLMPDYDAIDALLGGLFTAPAPGLRPAGKSCPDPEVAVERNYGTKAPPRRPPPEEQ